MKKLGLITIGQSPRIDVVPEIRQIIGHGIEVMEGGALDGLTLDEVRKLYPRTRRLRPHHEDEGRHPGQDRREAHTRAHAG